MRVAVVIDTMEPFRVGDAGKVLRAVQVTINLAVVAYPNVELTEFYGSKALEDALHHIKECLA